MTADKTLTAVTGTDVATGTSFSGYEMHVGRTTGPGANTLRVRPIQCSASRTAPSMARRAPTAACPAPTSTACSLTTPSAPAGLSASAPRRLNSTIESDVEATLDALADHLEAHIDCDRLLALARVPGSSPALYLSYGHQREH